MFLPDVPQAAINQALSLAAPELICTNCIFKFFFYFKKLLELRNRENYRVPEYPSTTSPNVTSSNCNNQSRSLLPMYPH